MDDLINKCDGDPRIVIAAIRNSTIEYSLHQKWLIAVIEEASTIHLASNGTRDPLILRYCVRIFGEALKSQLNEERNNAKEILFYIEQRQIYRQVYDVLTSSAFPYSSRQREMLSSMRIHLEEATGNPRSYADAKVMSSLRIFLDLLAREDHLSTKDSARFIITSTIDYHMESIIKELRCISLDERKRNHLITVLDMSLLDVATYVTTRLREIFNGQSIEKSESIFRAGYREIFNKLINIFKDSNFPFTLRQHLLIRRLCQSVSTFGGDPYTKEYEDLKMKFLEFMDSIRHDSPIREIINTSTTIMTDPNGPVTKAVDYITNGLQHLSRAASDHFMSFKENDMEPPDLVSTMFFDFLRIYPPRYAFPQPRAHNIATTCPGSFPYF